MGRRPEVIETSRLCGGGCVLRCVCLQTLGLGVGGCLLELRTDNEGYSLTFSKQMGAQEVTAAGPVWSSSGRDSGRRAPFLSHASCPTELVVLGHSGSHGYGVGVGLGDRSGVRLDTGQGLQGASSSSLLTSAPQNPPPHPPLPYPALPGDPRAGGPG